MKENILSTVKQYIDNSLDLRKHSVLNLLEEDFEETPSMKNILAELGLTEEQYYNPLSISSGSDFQIHIKRATNVLLITFSLKDFKYGKQTLNVIICTTWYYLVLKLVHIDRLISYALQSFHHSIMFY